ncbi:MAG: hypothetical protein BGO12_07255 [Verrucomicrobia bacterium 61-8]|nr:hypothetical protein [Verrucomicrobiota bacterium]OJV20920.1 MAG: hypothetical protein BGO12_07255 [Verrucomicrobia bacterium 61-8]
MPELDQILACFPSVPDWKEVYLDDGRQRILGDAGRFSVEIILGSSLDHVCIFSDDKELEEMLSVMELFLESRDSALIIQDRVRISFTQNPDTPFHSILGTHTLTIFRINGYTHFRISPSIEP